jgi:AraC family transcriptional regulator
MLKDTTCPDWAMVQVDDGIQNFSPDAQPLFRERGWRNVDSCMNGTTDDVVLSRWTGTECSPRQAEATSPADRYFIGVALKATRLKLTRDGKTIFEGPMPAGSLYVSAPMQRTSAQFDATFDFLHLHLSTAYFSRSSGVDRLNDLVLLRNPFVEQLAKALIEKRDDVDQRFAHCIAQVLAMHIAKLERPQSRVNPLPKWRLRRVEEHIKLNLHGSVRLSDLANVAGLSRMHFAAQFRVATGYRPLEYLTHQRTEYAKSLLLTTKAPLADIALSAGYCTQAHFSTVFKRITGETPARWRAAHKDEAHAVPFLRSTGRFASDTATRELARADHRV